MKPSFHQHQTTKKRSKLYDKFLSIDQFADKFELKVDSEGDKQTQPSITGSICSIIFITIVLGYTLQKSDFLIKRKGVDILTNIEEFYFPESYTFTAEMGLNFAVAFTPYDSESEYALPPEIGELVFIRS